MRSSSDRGCLLIFVNHPGVVVGRILALLLTALIVVRQLGLGACARASIVDREKNAGEALGELDGIRGVDLRTAGGTLRSRQPEK